MSATLQPPADSPTNGPPMTTALYAQTPIDFVQAANSGGSDYRGRAEREALDSHIVPTPRRIRRPPACQRISGTPSRMEGL
jgi:hypothetical protein